MELKSWEAGDAISLYAHPKIGRRTQPAGQEIRGSTGDTYGSVQAIPQSTNRLRSTKPLHEILEQGSGF